MCFSINTLWQEQSNINQRFVHAYVARRNKPHRHRHPSPLSSAFRCHVDGHNNAPTSFSLTRTQVVHSFGQAYSFIRYNNYLFITSTMATTTTTNVRRAVRFFGNVHTRVDSIRRADMFTPERFPAVLAATAVCGLLVGWQIMDRIQSAAVRIACMHDESVYGMPRDVWVWVSGLSFSVTPSTDTVGDVFDVAGTRTCVQVQPGQPRTIRLSHCVRWASSLHSGPISDCLGRIG